MQRSSGQRCECRMAAKAPKTHCVCCSSTLIIHTTMSIQLWICVMILFVSPNCTHTCKTTNLRVRAVTDFIAKPNKTRLPRVIDKQSVGKHESAESLAPEKKALILQIKGESKQNKINIDVLAQVKGLNHSAELNRCTSCKNFTASFHRLPTHHCLQFTKCHMTGCVFSCPLGSLCFCFNSFLYCAPLCLFDELAWS